MESLNVTWQRIALRLFQRFSDRLHARIAFRIGPGSFRRISPSRCVARASTRSHHAPVTIISSYIGRADVMYWRAPSARAGLPARPKARRRDGRRAAMPWILGPARPAPRSFELKRFFR